MVLSITIALFAERELVSPGNGKIKETLFSVVPSVLIAPPPESKILKDPLVSET